ncbi:MAG: acyltransferase, partial [Oxalobacteraceae bacterium]
MPIIAATTTLIAISSRATLVTRALASQPMVAIGLISYASYLWHHPLLSFTRIVWPNALSQLEAIGLLLLAMALGTASYHLIERPARDLRRVPSRIFWPLTLLFGGALFVSALLVWRADGVPARLPPALQAVAAMSDAYPKMIDGCFISSSSTLSLEETCIRGSRGPVRTALVGDSHAMALAPGFDPLLEMTGSRARLLIAAGCPLIDDPRALSDLQKHCPEVASKVLKYIMENKEIQLVAMAARWPYAFARSFYDNGEGGVEIGPDDGLEPNASRDQLFEASLS